MTTPLTKLIEDNIWRPIAEATADDLKRQLLVRLPRNNGKYGITTAIYIGKHEMRAEDWNWENEDHIDRDEENDVDYVPEGWFEQIESDCSDYGWFGLHKSNSPTHFRPLPGDRLARVTENIIDEVEQTIATVKNMMDGMLQAGILPSELANYACIISRLESALEQATAIAEGKE